MRGSKENNVNALIFDCGCVLTFGRCYHRSEKEEGSKVVGENTNHRHKLLNLIYEIRILQPRLGIDQILDLVKQLPKKDKIRLSKELEREIIDTKLTALLEAFKTNDLEQETINEEVEIVRAEIYARSKAM